MPNDNPTESPKNEGLPELGEVVTVLDWQIREARKRRSSTVTGKAALAADVARLERARATVSALAREASREGVGDANKRLRDAIEGECDGLGITQESADAILNYIGFSPQGRIVGGREIGGVWVIEATSHSELMPNQQLVRYDEYLRATAAQPEPVVSGGVEQRARELLDSECPECGGDKGFEVPGDEGEYHWHNCGTCRDGERLHSVNREQALRAITSALSAAKPQAYETLRNAIYDAGERFGRATPWLTVYSWLIERDVEISANSQAGAKQPKKDMLLAELDSWQEDVNDAKSKKWPNNYYTVSSVQKMIDDFRNALTAPQSEAKPQAGEVCPNCERLTDIHHCQACGADFAAVDRPQAGEFKRGDRVQVRTMAGTFTGEVTRWNRASYDVFLDSCVGITVPDTQVSAAKTSGEGE